MLRPMSFFVSTALLGRHGGAGIVGQIGIGLQVFVIGVDLALGGGVGEAMRRQGGQLLLGHVDDDLLIVVGHGELVPAERDIPFAQAQEPADADDDVANLAVLIDQRALDLARPSRRRN